MKDITISFWNRKRGEDKISKKWEDIEDFQKWLTTFEGETSGMITLKHNGGYGKNNKTGHTAIINFKNHDNEGIADLIRPIVSCWD